MTDKVAKNDLLDRVDEFLGDTLVEVECIFTSELESVHPYVNDVLTQVASFRGKRLRPILLLLTAKACGEINHNHKVLAAVVEMIHTATLVHDDILDDAETRRHVATVNARWNNETSVLFGDYLFTHAFHLASSLESTQACRLIGRATNIVCEGELAQIHERGNLELSEDSYLQIINGKTAELCAICCRLGAIYSNANEDVVDSLEQFGRSLGMAFQIADDVLDLVGSEQKTGKSLGSDLQKQKLTLPLIRLLDQASAETATQIREILSRPSDESSRALQPFLEESDALFYTLNRANEFAAEARRQLQSLPDSVARQILDNVIEFTTQRTF